LGYDALKIVTTQGLVGVIFTLKESIENVSNLSRLLYLEIFG